MSSSLRLPEATAPKLEFGIMDGFEAESGDTPAWEAYDRHIAYAQDVEAHGYRYYFFIEHQNAFFPCISAPNAYLAALAREGCLM